MIPKELLESAKKFSILVVDDEPDVLMMEREIFSMIFGDVTTASDGVEAMEKLKERPYDILFTDLTMPRMDGLELAREAKKLRPNQRIVIISARDSAEYLLESIKLGVDGYLLKPLEREVMFETIEKVVSLLEAERMIKNYQQELEQELQKKSEELKKSFYTDKVTKLPNREALLCELNKKRASWGIYVDIDNFNSINLVHGFEKGNEVLRQIGEILKDFGEAYALGADRFFLLREDELDKKIGYEIIDRIANAHFTGDIQLTATIAMSDKEPLLQTAEIALKDIRHHRRNTVGVYNDQLPTEILQRKIRKYFPLLKEAIEKQRIVPYFQPIWSVKEERIIKYEALARFVDETGNLHPAFEFIEVAKISGLVDYITFAMIKKSFEIFAKRDEDININIESADLENERFFDFLLEQQRRWEIEPGRVTFEVLETINDHSQLLEERLLMLRNMGYKIAIDDFGSANSNFERIHAINAETIKIDGKYIKDITTNKKSYEIVRAIVNFSKNLGYGVVAEFVSDEETYKIVKDLGVDFVQGWFIGKPQMLGGE